MSDKNALQTVSRELKQFKRIPQAEMVGGVCAGIAYRLEMPTWGVRLVFMAMILGLGFGFIPYLLLWWLVPTTDTMPRDYRKRTGDNGPA